MHNVGYICPVAGLERMTTGSAVSALSYQYPATQVGRKTHLLTHCYCVCMTLDSLFCSELGQIAESPS